MSAVIGIAGFSNSGKTTMISRLVEHFASQGLRTAVIKHDGHGHYKEAEGTDSSLYKDAGAAATVVVSPDSYTAFRRIPVTLEQIIGSMLAENYDLILVEGFKNGPHDKLALFRNIEQAEILNVLPVPPVAVSAPGLLKDLAPASIPFFDSDDIGGIAAWMENRIKKNTV